MCAVDGKCTQAPGRHPEPQLLAFLHRVLAVAVALPFLVAASPAAASPPGGAAAVVSEPVRLAPPTRASRNYFRPTVRRVEVLTAPTPAVKPSAKPVKTSAKPAKAPVAPSQPAAPKPVKAVRRAPAAEVAPVEASGNAAAIVRFVLAQVGESYVFGATGPSSWDCSGLAQAAARIVGVNLPHDADAQRRYGRPVTRAELQPGDLVFWPGHVGVAIGGGMMVAAANSREGVVRQKIYGTPIAYRRLV